DVLRRDRIAERLRHLLAVLVHGETMSHDGVIWRPTARAAAFQKRRMEPATMLVRAFQIDISRPFHVRTIFQRESMRRTRIEPDVQDIAYLRPAFIGAAAEEPLARTFGKPRIGAFCLERFKDALVDGIILKDVAFLIHENADRHAPRPLARKYPVRPAFDHRAQTRLTRRWHKTSVVNGFQRA